MLLTVPPQSNYAKEGENFFDKAEEHEECYESVPKLEEGTQLKQVVTAFSNQFARSLRAWGKLIN